MRVTVCYALPMQQDLCTVELPDGATVRDALRASEVARRHGLDLEAIAVGVFARRRALDDAVADGERVEIYRALTVDAKTARRRRAEKDAAAKTASRQGRPIGR